jgi:hypothetical protein
MDIVDELEAKMETIHSGGLYTEQQHQRKEGK